MVGKHLAWDAGVLADGYPGSGGLQTPLPLRGWQWVGLATRVFGRSIPLRKAVGDLGSLD